MSIVQQIVGDAYIYGNLGCQTFTPPAGSITDAAVLQGANIQSTKVIHRHWEERELFGPTTTIVAVTTRLLRMTNIGNVISFTAEIEVDATDPSRTVTIDLQKSTGGGAFASILTSTINITNTTTIRTAVAATINSAGLLAGDILQAVVTVAGGAGVQAQGLGLTLVTDRNP